MTRLVELAETLQCAVVDIGGRMNFPSRHPLNQSFRRGVGRSGRRDRRHRDRTISGARSIRFSDRIERTSRRDLPSRAPRSSRSAPATSTSRPTIRTSRATRRSISRSRGDGEADAAGADRSGEAPGRRRPQGGLEARGKKLAAAQLATLEQAQCERHHRLGCEPDLGRRGLCTELYAQIKDEDWSLVGTSTGNNLAAPAVEFRQASQLERRLGRRRHRLHAAGLARRRARQQAARPAHASPSAATATSCSRPARCGRRRITASRCSTSCTTTAPITRNTCTCRRWPTAAAAASRSAISAPRSTIPNIDYATVAKGFGVYGEGPITDPKDLAPALKRAIAVVKSGQPALVDVVTDPR